LIEQIAAMHTLFEATTATEILNRLEKIQADTPPLWGKMNAAQMMAHCQAPFESFFSQKQLRRGLIGYLFGRVAKKKLFSEKPWPRSLPTAKAYTITNQREFNKEKEKLIGWINRFASEGYTVTTSTHPFFGKMSSQEWALLAYKHMNHHLTQFGA
jgi:hypothetical protein